MALGPEHAPHRNIPVPRALMYLAGSVGFFLVKRHVGRDESREEVGTDRY